MSVLISNTDYSNIPAFADEVRSAFKSAVPPVCIAIDTKENVELFTQMFPSERGYLGKRVACKHAMIGSFNNFSINEIFSFGEERYPIQLSFKQISELEDFAKGWQRTIEKASTPVIEPSTTAPIEEAPKPKEEKPIEKHGRNILKEVKEQFKEGSTSARAHFETMADIEDFATSVGQEYSLVGIAVAPESSTFECKISGMLSSKQYPVKKIVSNTPCYVSFEDLGEVKLFAATVKEYLSQEAKKKAEKERVANNVVSQNTQVEDFAKQYPVNPLAEKILDNILKTNLVLSWIIGILLIFGGISGGAYMLDDGMFEGLGVVLILLSIVGGVLIILLGYHRWALGKVQINISRNLFSINKKIK